MIVFIATLLNANCIQRSKEKKEKKRRVKQAIVLKEGESENEQPPVNRTKPKVSVTLSILISLAKHLCLLGASEFSGSYCVGVSASCRSLFSCRIFYFVYLMVLLERDKE